MAGSESIPSLCLNFMFAATLCNNVVAFFAIGHMANHSNFLVFFYSLVIFLINSEHQFIIFTTTQCTDGRIYLELKRGIPCFFSYRQLFLINNASEIAL